MVSHGLPLVQPQRPNYHLESHSSMKLVQNLLSIDSCAMQPIHSKFDEKAGITAVAEIEKGNLLKEAPLNEFSNPQSLSSLETDISLKNTQESRRYVKFQHENGGECNKTNTQIDDHSTSNGYIDIAQNDGHLKTGFKSTEEKVSIGSGEDFRVVQRSNVVPDSLQNLQQKDVYPTSIGRQSRSAKRLLSEQSKETEVFENSDNSSEISEEENDNESTCGECHGGGELVCCDGCVKAYHAGCLSPSKRPRLDSDGDWYCPVCISRRSQRGKRRLEKKSVSNFHLPPLASSTSSAAINLTSGETYYSASSHPALQVCSSNSTANSVINNLGGGMRTLNPSLSRSPSTVVPTVETRYFRRKKKPIDEGPKEANRINIGPRYQVPAFPSFFLNRDEDEEAGEVFEQARLVYSPFSMERVRKRRLMDGGASIIRDDSHLSDFVMYCAKTWRSQEGWQPFSPEFAYKLLHSAEYDPERAIRMMKEPHFCFDLVCDPPRRKYENKWKPTDRRGGSLTSPYPPPGAVKSYFSRRTNTSYMLR